MKKSIADYLRQGAEGPYFYRMVETVLSRDKNWVRWKSENCPSIELAAISPEAFAEAKRTAQRTATNKRLRAMPMGSLPLGFLQETDEQAAMEKLKSEERYQIPELDSFQRKIADDDFEIEMPTNNQTKAAAVESKASKSWRALRIASKFKLSVFDKIEDPDKINPIFEEQTEMDEAETDVEPTAEESNMPRDRSPVIISGPVGSGKSTLAKMLIARHPGVFGMVVRHTTRPPLDSEISGQQFHFVDVKDFNTMVDGDQMLEFRSQDGVEYGTNKKSIESVIQSGKVPLLTIDWQVRT
jgi:THO complex subunit 1